MADTHETDKANNRAAPSPHVDPVPPDAVPVMMTDAYVEIGGANLSCLGLEVSIEPELKPIEQTTFCGVKDYPGPSKWHFKCKLAQSFSVGATDETLQAALDAYKADGSPCDIKVRPTKADPSATNPQFETAAIPQDYTVFGGAAGAASEVDLDWICDAPTRVITVGP